MTPAYLLIATRAPDRSAGLKIGYPTKEHAIAAADIVGQSWSSVTVTAPDGSLILQLDTGRDG